MKKITLISLAAIAATFSFSSCQKNEVPAPEQEVKGNFSIYADITKTTIEGLSTAWADADAINVFHTENGGTTYGSNDKFSIAESGLTTGQFTGTLTTALESGSSYDWYALYPYSNKIVTPSEPKAGYIHIGCANSYKTAQTQNGNNSTAHLAGQHFPLYAQAKNVDSGATVSLNFKPVLSIVKFHVTNKTTEPLTVSSVKMTAEEEKITGSYYIDFCEDTPVLTPSGSDYVSNTAQLSVTNGTEIAADESADFYLAIKPFTNVAGKSITFIVNGCEKSITTAQTFNDGEVKTINFNYDKQPKVLEEGAYVALVQNSGTSYFAMTSTDDGASTKRFKSADVTYDGAKTFKTADASIVWNLTKSDGSWLFENGGQYIAWSGSGNSAILSATPYKLNLIENGDYYNIKSNADASRILSKNSSNQFFAFYGTLTQKYNFLLVPAELSADPVINPITAPNKVAAAGKTGVEVSYTISNPVAGKSVSAVSAQNWVKNFSYATAGKITFDVEANSAEEERSSEITVSYEGAADVKFTVTQAGTASSTVYTLQFTKSDNNNAYATMYDVTINGIGWKAPGNQALDPDATYGGKIKIGGKLSAATDRYMYSKAPIGGALKTITFRHSSKDSEITVNSLTVSSYSTAADAESGSNAKDTKIVTYADNDETSINVSGENWTGKYIRINYNLSSTLSSKNKGIVLYYVKFEY